MPINFCSIYFAPFLTNTTYSQKKLERVISRILYSFQSHDHFTGITVTRYLMQPTRRHQASNLWDEPVSSYLVLLRMGFTLPCQSPVQAVSFYLAISPLPNNKLPGGIFSVALSASRPAFALRTILLYGVRTFLSGLKSPSDHAPAPKLFMPLLLPSSSLVFSFPLLLLQQQPHGT